MIPIIIWNVLLLLVLLRGYLLTRASGFRFYFYRELFSVITLGILIVAGPYFQGDALFFTVLIGIIVGGGAIEFMGRRKAAQERPEQWERWDAAYKAVKPLDHLLMRYPKVESQG